MFFTKLFFVLIFLPLLCFCQSLHLWGGQGNLTYLGCLNSNKYDVNSIWNTYGTYGSKYNLKSIWNAYGTFGSKYSSYSPWNIYSSTPPVVCDSNGVFYGHFTLNRYKQPRAEFQLALTVYEYHELIREDVGEWFDHIFR